MAEYDSTCPAGDSMNYLLLGLKFGTMIRTCFCLYDVAKAGDYAFKQRMLQFVNGNNRERLKEDVKNGDLDIPIAFLMRNDRVPTFKASDSRMIHQTVIRDLILRNNGLYFEELECSSNKADVVKKNKEQFPLTTIILDISSRELRSIVPSSPVSLWFIFPPKIRRESMEFKWHERLNKKRTKSMRIQIR